MSWEIGYEAVGGISWLGERHISRTDRLLSRL